MKQKQLFRMLLAAVCLLVGTSAWAEKLDATVKMTYVDKNNAETSYGEIAAGETARTGYNKISGGSVAFANEGWGVNYITYLQVDASAIPSGATITNATLSFEQSGSTDGTTQDKRTTTVGAGYNSSTWSNTMTFSNADKSIKTIGATTTTTTKRANVFENKNIDITAAFTGDDDNVVTILLYETAAAGCYIKNPSVTIDYTTASAYDVTFTETNGVSATVKIGDADVTSGTKLVNGTYNFTATAAGYETYNGNFTVSGADKEVEFAMTAKTPVTSITVNYKYNDEVVYSEAQSSIDGLYVGDSYNVPFRMYVMNGSVLYKSTKNSDNPWYGEPTTLTANTVIEKAVTPVDLGGGTIVLFEDLDNSTAQNAGIRASYCSAYDNKSYTSAEDLPAGTYDFIVFAQNKGRNSSVKVGETTVFTITDVVSGTGSWTEKTIPDVVVPTAEKMTIAAGSAIDDYDIIIAVLKSVPATITQYGYATFSSTYPVNVDVDGLEAYIVTGKSESGSSIITEKIEGDVAANAGLILKGNAGTYSLPVVASGTTYDKSSEHKNYLFACDGTHSTVDAADEGTNYVLSVQNNKVVFAPIGETSAPIKKGQAALWLPASGNAKALTLSFGDDVTGIEAVSTVEPQDAKTYYNLQGQRVSEPKQGIYVVDGKKVLVK